MNENLVMNRDKSPFTLHSTDIQTHISVGLYDSELFLFQSKHETAEFHAAARAIGGCAVYVR